jgi:hypothetical protein
MAMVFIGAAPAGAATDVLDGPSPAIWLSDPEGDVGANGIEQGDLVEGSSGTARVNKNGATITVKATGLEQGHAYTMWVVYFSDQTQCVDGCNGADLPDARGGVLFGDGKVADGSGELTFTARLNDGDGAPPGPPPPFAFAPYEAGPDNEFHVVIRSHGPTLAGEVSDQIHTYGGGCAVEVGPPPEGVGDFPVPAAPGECGDVQLYVFS